MSDRTGNQQDGWFMLSVSLPRELEETASTLLFELGSTGIVALSESETDIQIAGYFAASANMNEISCQVASGLAKSRAEGSAEIAISYVPNQDWLQKWKEGYEPVAIGDRLLIVPSWKLESVMKRGGPGEFDELIPTQSSNRSAREDGSGRIIILIDPGMAFGTGTHETTRLCLEMIERFWRGGSLLDVGAGTGILAIAAAKLAPGSKIIGIDIDPVAVEVARENATMNGVPEIDFREANPANVSELFDVVVANLTADLIATLLDDLIGLIAPGGYLLVSGILREQAEDVERAIKASSLEISERSNAGEWVAYAARKD